MDKNYSRTCLTRSWLRKSWVLCLWEQESKCSESCWPHDPGSFSKHSWGSWGWSCSSFVSSHASHFAFCSSSREVPQNLKLYFQPSILCCCKISNGKGVDTPDALIAFSNDVALQHKVVCTLRVRHEATLSVWRPCIMTQRKWQFSFCRASTSAAAFIQERSKQFKDIFTMTVMTNIHSNHGIQDAQAICWDNWATSIKYTLVSILWQGSNPIMTDMYVLVNGFLHKKAKKLQHAVFS